jgi:hypothetical protein
LLERTERFREHVVPDHLVTSADEDARERIPEQSDADDPDRGPHDRTAAEWMGKVRTEATAAITRMRGMNPPG